MYLNLYGLYVHKGRIGSLSRQIGKNNFIFVSIEPDGKIFQDGLEKEPDRVASDWKTVWADVHRTQDEKLRYSSFLHVFYRKKDQILDLLQDAVIEGDIDEGFVLQKDGIVEFNFDNEMIQIFILNTTIQMWQEFIFSLPAQHIETDAIISYCGVDYDAGDYEKWESDIILSHYLPATDYRIHSLRPVFYVLFKAVVLGLKKSATVVQ